MKRNVIDQSNLGKPALIVYADMNNLKLINDQFGHEEGDYALQMIGQILQESIHELREKGSAGRIGGDEFSAYLITEEDDQEAALRSRIDEITERMNRENDKPYYVSMSVGIRHFVCAEEINISELMEQADEQLYEYKKKKKRKSILKKEELL